MPSTNLHQAIDEGSLPSAIELMDRGVNLEELQGGLTPLHYAIEKNQTAIAKELIARGADKEIICGNWTPLIRAIFNGQKEIAQALINARANVEIPIKTDRGDFPPLGFAIKQEQPEIALALIEAGADVNVIVNEASYLHAAIEKQQTDVANALIARGANIEFICDNITPLIRTILKEQKEIALVLINARANVEIPIKTDRGDYPPLGFAIKQEQPEIALALIDAGADINVLVDGESYLHVAIDNEQTEIAKALIARGANKEIIFNNARPLIRAILFGQEEIALALINARVDVEIPIETDRGDVSPLGVAIDKNQPKIALALIAAGADVNGFINGAPYLHFAIERQQTKIAIALIARGANKEIIFKNGTPLIRAILFGQEEIALALINARVDVEIPIETDRGDVSPLGVAIDKNQPKIALALIAAGADVNGFINEASYLHSAIAKQQTEIAKVLILRGANLETQCNEYTPLQEAVLANNPVVTEALIKNGAKISVKYRESSLLDLALTNGNPWIVRLIVDSGVKEISVNHRQKMSDLHYAIILGDEALVSAELEKNNSKDVTYNGMLPLEIALYMGRSKIAEMLIGAGVKKEISFDVLCASSERCSLSLMTSLVPHSLIYKIPLSRIINHNFFDSQENVKNLWDECSNGVKVGAYILKHQLVSPVKLQCLAILEMVYTIKVLDNLKRKKIAAMGENADADKDVLQANKHYRETIVPYLAEHYKTVSLEDTEKEIRELILKEIVKECEDYCKINVENFEECNRKNSIKQFIVDNGSDLVEGKSSTLEASATLIVDNTRPQAAWRGYNPFAKVSGKFANLLTPSENDVEIFSTQASHEGKLSEKEGSLLVRTRVADYFRFVVDKNDGDVSDKIANFLIQLSEMRNAHGLNDPSCFPGYLTRIAKMGAFHSVGKLPCDFVEFLHDHFRTKVLQQFKEEYNSKKTLEEKCDLLASLTDLNETSARDIILDEKDYAESLYAIRMEFMEMIGTVDTIFEEIKNSPQAIIFDENDEAYILQYLVDVSRNEIGTMLADYHRRALDKAPTPDELNAANPFNESEEKEHALFDLIFAQIPSLHIIRTKYSAFENMRDVLKAKVVLMLKEKNQVENIVTEIFSEELSEDKVTKMIALIKALPFMQPSTEPVMTSRFVHEIALLRKNHSTMPASIQNRLKSLEQKNALFEDVFPKVKAAFMENDAFCKEFAECLAIHLFLHARFTMESFCEDERGNFANEYQHYFTAQSRKLCALEEMLNLDPVPMGPNGGKIAVRI